VWIQRYRPALQSSGGSEDREVKRWKPLAAVALALLVLTLLPACGKRRATPTPQPTATEQTPVPEDTPTAVPTLTATLPVPTTESDTVVVLVADSIETMDPYRMVRVHPEGSIASHVWESLTWLNDDLEIDPHLAESWWMIDDCTWEFVLRPDVVFHNGEQLDAQAVRFSIERSRSLPGSTETFAQDVGLAKVEVPSDRIVRLTTREPVPDLPYHLAFLEILPPGHYAGLDTEQAGDAPVGSGPYRVDEWLPGQEVTLVAVPSYWGGAPRWARVVFRALPDLQGRLRGLREEELSVVTDLAPIKAERWDVAGTRLETIESVTRMLVGIRAVPDTPLADRRVRQALNYGVDVERVVDEWLEGYGDRYGSWVNPPGSSSALAPWPYDPDLARQLLEEAGYGDGFSATLSTPDGAYYQDAAIAQSIAQQWDEIGVQVELEVVEWGTYVEQLLSDDPPPLYLLAMNSRGHALQDVQNVSPAWPYNPGGWQDPLFEQQLQHAKRTFDPQARATSLDELQDLAYQEAPWIWLWRPYRFYGVSERLDWAPRRDGLVYLYEPRSN
jgi:peptide/nickel transport system substrate-binding protein